MGSALDIGHKNKRKGQVFALCIQNIEARKILKWDNLDD